MKVIKPSKTTKQQATNSAEVDDTKYGNSNESGTLSTDYLNQNESQKFHSELQAHHSANAKKKNKRHSTNRNQSSLTSVHGDDDDALETSEAGDDQINRLIAKGIHLLATREHSELEVANKLKRTSDNLEHIHAAIKHLKTHDCLSNERFVESYVRSRVNRGYGPVKIEVELRQKGINDSMAFDYIDHHATSWTQNAKRAYYKKFKDSPIPNYKEWSKRARFLQSKGFTSNQITAAIPFFDSDSDSL